MRIVAASVSQRVFGNMNWQLLQRAKVGPTAAAVAAVAAAENKHKEKWKRRKSQQGARKK